MRTPCTLPLLLALLVAACGTNELANRAQPPLQELEEDTGSGSGELPTPPGGDDRDGGPPLDDATTPGGPLRAETICDDGIDNDGNGLVDCADPVCFTEPVCEGLAPSEINCVDGIDNDSNGLIDCDDPGCERTPVCGPVTGPPDLDAGGGGDDPDAASPPVPPEGDAGSPPDTAPPEADGGAPPPSEGVLIPFEFQCDDGLDNDRDGLTDCADPDCDLIPPCVTGGSGPGVPTIPFEFQCGDGLDNDLDGKVDCADEDCRWIPPCLRF
jgi:hypothetical protein